MDSRSDSLAAKLQRAGLLDEYFAWWLGERPSIAARKEWLEKAEMPHSNDAISNLHKSSEAAVWRNAAAAKARAAMEAGLPKNIRGLIRKSLLDQRFNHVMGELSHKELMDQFMLEGETERIQIKREELAVKKEALKISREKMETDSCKRFLTWFKDAQAREIAESGLSNADKIARLRQTYFADVDKLEAEGGIQIPD
ncbi:MAG: hypothetical protein ACOYM3_04615 [Terrimicrobiaceae bacterium]